MTDMTQNPADVGQVEWRPHAGVRPRTVEPFGVGGLDTHDIEINITREVSDQSDLAEILHEAVLPVVTLVETPMRIRIKIEADHLMALGEDSSNGEPEPA